MIEQEWVKSTDPRAMLQFLRGKVSQRQLLLFAFGCCRRLWHLLSDERTQQAVVVSERFADGTATSQEQEAAFQGNWGLCEGAEGRAGLATTAVHSAASSMHNSPPQFEINPLENADSASRWAAHAIASPKVDRISVEDEFPDLVPWVSERAAQAVLLRCIVGPAPFRLVTFEDSWQTGTVVSLAQTIYDDRTFDRMPILGDALEEVGCTNPEILNHCRQPGVHVRGCWVVDLLLDKE